MWALREGMQAMVPGPLRIWLVSQSYLPYHGGITEHVWHLSHELALRGHAVTILTGAPLPARSLGGDSDPPGVRLLRVGRTLRVPSHGARACVTLGWNWGAQLRGSNGGRPDIVHIQSPLEPFLPLWMLHHAPGLKIGTFHTGGAQRHWGYQRFGPLLQRAVRKLDVRIGVSQEAVRFAGQHFPGHYEIIPNGVDTRRFGGRTNGADAGSFAGPARGSLAAREVARPAPLGTDPPPAQLLYVGRLDPRKGLPVLLEALRILRSQQATQALSDVRLTIVGCGPLRGELQQLARRNRLPVRFAGAVTRTDLPGYYAAADLFVAPSVDGESFGISLLEALAAGLPVAASAITGYRETLRGLRAARLSPPGDAGVLAGTIAELLALRRSTDHWQSHRAAARRFAQRFSWPRIAAQTERIYERALRHAHRSAAAPPQRKPRPRDVVPVVDSSAVPGARSAGVRAG